MSETVDTQRSDGRDGIREHDSDATSSETLEDLEQGGSDLDSDESAKDPGPSPDGAFDEPVEIRDAEPM